MPLVWSAQRFERCLTSRSTARELGRGAYGAVIELNKKSDRVLKICSDVNDGWPVYAHWCMTQAPANPHLLEVYSIREVNAEHRMLDTFVVASIERLVDYRNGNALDRKLRQELREQVDMVMSCCYSLLEQLAYGRLEDHTQRLKDKCPSLFEALVAVLEHARDTECGIDLHAGNFMYRPSTQTLVITDPYNECARRRRFSRVFRPDPKRSYESESEYHERLKRDRQDFDAARPYVIGRIRQARQGTYRTDRHGQYVMF